MRLNTRRKGRGFTWVEVMVVIVIIGLLATILIANMMPARNTARDKAEADIALLYQSVERYRLDMFAYPTQTQGLRALVTVPPDAAHPDRYRTGGYMRRLPNDPWGRPYHYRIPGIRSQFDVFSLGADGRPGGTGDNADFGAWK